MVTIVSSLLCRLTVDDFFPWFYYRPAVFGQFQRCFRLVNDVFEA